MTKTFEETWQKWVNTTTSSSSSTHRLLEACVVSATTLEELHLTFLEKAKEANPPFISELNLEIVNTPRYQISHSLDLGKDFFHPPQG